MRDELLAHRFHLMEQLTMIYGFEEAVVEQALDALLQCDEIGMETAAGGVAAVVATDPTTTTTIPTTTVTTTSNDNDTPPPQQQQRQQHSPRQQFVFSLDATTVYNYILDNRLATDRGGPVIPIHDCPHVRSDHCLSLGTTTTTTTTTSSSSSIHSYYNRDDAPTPSTGTNNDPMMNQLQRILSTLTPDRVKCGYYEEEEEVEETGDNVTTTMERTRDISSSNQQQQQQQPRGKSKLKAERDAVDGSCQSSEYWFCLQCGAIRCSRYDNGHALEHWEKWKTLSSYHRDGIHEDDDGGGVNTRGSGGGIGEQQRFEQHHQSHHHALALSLTDLSVWCYACQAYVEHESREDGRLSSIVKSFQQWKFGG